MDAVQQYEQRLAAYRRLKPAIEQGYAKGSFVAIADDRVIASARSFRESKSQFGHKDETLAKFSWYRQVWTFPIM